MCLFSTPSIPPPPVAASFQPTQTPKDLTNGKSAKDAMKKRGVFASLFTPGGAQGILSLPMTTGTTGGSTGMSGG
jgi:hypothetical protein